MTQWKVGGISADRFSVGQEEPEPIDFDHPIFADVRADQNASLEHFYADAASLAIIISVHMCVNREIRIFD